MNDSQIATAAGQIQYNLVIINEIDKVLQKDDPKLSKALNMQMNIIYALYAQRMKSLPQ